jgi:hypothetical protein
VFLSALVAADVVLGWGQDPKIDPKEKRLDHMIGMDPRWWYAPFTEFTHLLYHTV